jgi:hypothetical protein
MFRAHLFRRLYPVIIVLGFISVALAAFSMSGPRGRQTAVSPAATTGDAARTPVLVELFTSEGCSTCPPADDLLADLVRTQPIPGVTVIGLGEHVDYWNQLGWTDRFSSGVYSERQRVYARNMKAQEVYTPQMVIGGSKESLGSDRSRVIRTIAAVAKEQAAVLTVSRAGESGGMLQVKVLLSGARQGDQPGLFAAVTDDADTTMVSAGENGGHSLQYTNTVRSMKFYGPISDGQEKLLSLQLPPDAEKKKMHVVVFAQPTSQGRVVAVASIPI